MIERVRRLQRFLPRVQAPPEWGIWPVPQAHRSLRFFDLFVLWSSLGVGLLVLEAGALLVPGLSLAQALLAILIGTLFGNLLLVLTGVIGSDSAVPTMVLLRPVLGQRGSYLPSLLNLVQLVGWTAFELWVMALAANQVSQTLFGFSAYGLWLVLFAIWCLLLALGGPLVVVRQWLEKFGVWLVYGVTVWMTFYLFTHYNIAALLHQAGTGELPFWLAVDLVMAMPISWMPLVADYTRFARSSKAAGWGTYLGYLVANIWFYGLGALFILTLKMTEPTPEGLAAAIMALTGGMVALLVILVDETDNAFADIYSAALTLQNIFPQLSQRLLVVVIGLLGLALAAFLTMGRYFNFLLLIGSVFVPLFGILTADYFVMRHRRLQVEELYRPGGAYWYRGGVNWVAVFAWAAGIAVYHFIARDLPWLGASIPSFAVAFLLNLVLAHVSIPVRRGVPHRL
ncbi:MAG: putative hydroxymethylpyrimidine transporter CytX [Ardenticatenaceae bacterium]|nr:putative hydroxymethylpyrimidine transporter CytX [Ardenticatenaceae bacterium]